MFMQNGATNGQACILWSLIAGYLRGKWVLAFVVFNVLPKKISMFHCVCIRERGRGEREGGGNARERENASQ